MGILFVIVLTKFAARKGFIILYYIILYYIRFDELSYGFNAMMDEVETMVFKRNVFLIAEPKSSLKEHKKTFNEEKRKFLDFMFESNLDWIGIYCIYK